MATKNALFNHLVEKRDTSVPSGKGTGLKNKQGSSFSRLVPLYEFGSSSSDGGGKGNFGTLALLNAGVPSPNEGDMATVDDSLGITGGASGVPALVTYQSGAWVVSQQLSGATTPVEDLLTSTSTTNALSANQGRILKEEQDNQTTSLGHGAGNTDMGVYTNPVTPDNTTQVTINEALGTAIAGNDTDITALQADSHPDDDVESVTGTAVDITDPRNPIINVSPNDHADDDVESVTGTAVDNTDPRNPVINLGAVQGVNDKVNGLDVTLNGTNVEVDFDFTELPLVATIDPVNDRVPIYDNDGTLHGYVTPNQISAGAGVTNLTIANHDAGSLDILSDTGTNVTLNAATIESGTNLAGLFTPIEKTQLIQQTIAYAATINANLNSGNIVYVDMTGDATIAAPSNTVSGETVTYILTANGADRTATFQSVIFKEEDGVTDTSAQVITSGTTKVFMYKVGPTVLHRVGGGIGGATWQDAGNGISVLGVGDFTSTTTLVSGTWTITVPSGATIQDFRLSAAKADATYTGGGFINGVRILVDDTANGTAEANMTSGFKGIYNFTPPVSAANSGNLMPTPTFSQEIHDYGSGLFSIAFNQVQSNMGSDTNFTIR